MAIIKKDAWSMEERAESKEPREKTKTPKRIQGRYKPGVAERNGKP
jgi:hypothetical protein